ncbi:MAG TPA: hypothetical protein PLJ78_16760 [Anaerolineae bacterium]|nr:hypothetical protein [Anaerolineae bacterium]HQK15583.1 hypothetical protein [Anaerolineae bacterium]
MTLAFEQIVDTVMQLPPEQQEILADLLRGWRIEARRREIARDANDSLNAYRAGKFKSKPASAIINQLHESAEDK